MDQIRHGSATTTPVVCAAIQRSQASLAQLTRELGINPKTEPCPEIPDWELIYSQRRGSSISKGRRLRFTAEFKEQAVARLSNPGATRASVAQELGMTSSQLKGWRLALEASGPAPVSFRSSEGDALFRGDRIWQRHTATNSSGTRFASR